MKSTGMTAKHIQLGYVIKFWNHSAWVSESCHQWCQDHSRECRKLHACSGILNQNICLQSKGDLMQGLVGNHWSNVSIYKWHKLFIGVGCICEGKALVNDQWPVNGKFFFFAVQEDQKLSCATIKHATVNMHKILWTCLRFESYTCQLLQLEQPRAFCCASLSKTWQETYGQNRT